MRFISHMNLITVAHCIVPIRMVDDNEIPNCEAEYGTLVGWIHSFLYGVHERIDIMYLDGKPTIEEVEAFMNNCVEVLHNPNKISREIANKLKGF